MGPATDISGMPSESLFAKTFPASSLHLCYCLAHQVSGSRTGRAGWVSGLFVSILVGLSIRVLSGRIDGPVAALSHAIERRVQFLSLADIAQRQLG